MSTALPTGPERGVRVAELLTGAGMALFALWTVQHFFAANYPATIWAGSFCDISAFFNCDSSAFSSIAAIAGVPIGFFGFMVGALFMLGAIFGAPALRAANRTLLLLNILGVVIPLFYSVRSTYVFEARTDPKIHDTVERIIQTGAEYEKTSDRYSHGIRSTPTMIINRRGLSPPGLDTAP